MKIAILTQPLHTNYGGLLQAYALQTTLRRLGHDTLVLDRHGSQPSRFRIFVRTGKRFISKYLIGRRDLEVLPINPSLEQQNILSRETFKFVRQYINKTKRLYSTAELKREAAQHQFDAYVVGSDQVWRLHYSPCITNYFLDIIESVPSIRRIAYAASFGVDHWHYNTKTTRQCKRLAQQFDAISVREYSGVDLCRQYLGVDSVHVLDPTMLLETDDYRALVLAENESASPGNMMTYVLDPSEEVAAVIQKVASALALKPFTVMPLQKLTRRTPPCIEECVFPSVTQWLRGYMDAKFVIADSFHGCVFAILFNIPFVAIANKKRGTTRFTSLLQRFNLTNRLIHSLAELTDELIHEPIDWNHVNKERSIFREFSTNFLRSNLD